ncbi:gag protease polyprotein [Cucumis melo var. makuwa]|uniref:Gag protease polyprotein n=1 Tax=Cucumis melo var. makuwa TaxID=1194695 RepID=A0A5A7UAI1_CUCMM|nr:gag protease polyprotein [Cucumis melo var. makuwa]TYK07836.1 gag protease polyprotein [Cucumis melo var. makuwa]
MLSYFARDMMRDEAARTEKFVRGLRLDIQGLVRVFRPTIHLEALRLAVDISLQESRNLLRQGKLPERSLYITPVGNAIWVIVCFGTMTCFKCRQEGHTADRCPMSLTTVAQNQGVGAPQQGKVFATNKSEAEKADTIVTSTLPVLGPYALVLFDSGSSYSFISFVFVSLACLAVEPLDHVLLVSTPSGKSMLLKEKIKACQIEIASHTIDVTLLVLDMHDFDLILGMDWLAANHASIDCSCREVVFNPSTGTSFSLKE